MWLRNSLILMIVSLSTVAHGQLFKDVKLPKSKLNIRKTGPFLGVEQGKYFNANFGVERQWADVKLVKPQTHALNLQFDYNFTQKQMGSQIGYWFKVGRLNLTYGARVSWHTDFDSHHLYSFSPNVGYKVLQAHFQLGVNLQQKNDYVVNNTFYASLRWVFINDWKLDREKKR